MASSSSNTKVVGRFCFLFLLVLFMSSHELGGVEGRRLRSERNVGEVGFQSSSVAAASRVARVDAFRPTAPGHSPGVGHSVHN
nr:precursor of CEP8-like [Ipomoea batatas]